MWYPDVNSIKPYFSMLSSTFHLHDLHAVLNLVQVPTQKSQGMQVVRTFVAWISSDYLESSLFPQ